MGYPDPRPRRNQRPLEPVTPPPPPGTRRTEPPLSRNNATVIQDDVPNRFNRTGETGSRIPVPNSSELEEENWIDEDEDFIDEPNAQSFPESVEGYNYEVVREPVAGLGWGPAIPIVMIRIEKLGGIKAILPTMQTTKLSPTTTGGKTTGGKTTGGSIFRGDRRTHSGGIPQPRTPKQSRFQ